MEDVACVKNGPSAFASLLGGVLFVEVGLTVAALNALNDPTPNVSGSTCFTTILRRGCNDSCGPCSNAFNVCALNVFGAGRRGAGGFRGAVKVDRWLTPAPETMSSAVRFDALKADRSVILSFSETVGAGSWRVLSRKDERNELGLAGSGVLSAITGFADAACGCFGGCGLVFDGSGFSCRASRISSEDSDAGFLGFMIDSP